jgi:hypothetical protein
VRLCRTPCLLVSLLAAATIVGPARASQGANVLQDTGVPTPNGVHSSITRNSMNPGSNGYVVDNVRMQSSLGLAAGLVQMGFYKTGPSFTSAHCGPANPYVAIFVEWGNDPLTLQCSIPSLALTSTLTQRFGVVASGSGGGCWNFFIDGVRYETHCVSWGSSSNIIGAGGEWGGSSFGTVNGTFGNAGSTPWELTRNGGASYEKIFFSGTYNDGGWSIGVPPSPFTIHN